MMVSTDRLALAEELSEVVQQLAQLSVLETNNADSLMSAAQSEPVPVTLEALQSLEEEYQRLAMLLQMYDWQEILPIVSWMRGHLTDPAAPAMAASGQFSDWLQLTAYTLQQQDSTHLAAVSQALMAEHWPEPLPLDVLRDFLLSLNPAYAQASESMPKALPVQQNELNLSGPTEKASANPAIIQKIDFVDNTLCFSDDTHPELIQAYLTEAPQQVIDVAALIRQIADTQSEAKCVSTHDSLRIKAVRLLHTIKGSSGVVGLNTVGRLSHTLEDLLEISVPYPPAACDTLVKAADCLEAMLDHLQTDHQLPSNYHTVYAELTDWAIRLNQGADKEDHDDTDKHTAMLGDPHQNKAYSPQAYPPTPHPNPVPGQQPNQFEYARHLLNLSGELIISNSQSGEYLQRSRQLLHQFHQSDDQLELHLQELDTMIQQSEKQHMERSAEQPEWQQAVSSGLEQYSEFQGSMNLLVELAADRRVLLQELGQQLRQLSDEFYQQQRMQRKLSDTVLATRLVAVERILPRLERIVRETCRETGKQATLTLQGGAIQLDSEVLQGLSDPLLHLLRNAVDHGIEPTEQRIKAGKPAQGVITLVIQQQGHQVLIRLEDDGAGLNKQAIIEQARAHGLVEKQQLLSEEELYRLVLLPGFSTRKTVSQLSGRGVGMDVVNSQIERLRGYLQLSSQAGKGMQVHITLPQTLTSTQALIVKVAERHLAIPADQVKQVLHINAGDSYEEDSLWHIRVEQSSMPVKQLAALLNWPMSHIRLTDPHTILLVRTSSTTEQAVYVNEVLNTREIVIKSLSAWFSIPGIQGACLLANGLVAPVLDMQRLWPHLNEEVVRLATQLSPALPEQVLGHQLHVPLLLVVDDSLSNRRAMQLMLEGMGYRVKTAVDGSNALQVLNETSVDAILTDMEMPRMNGLEMTQALRQCPENRHLPIIMITSRSTPKHRALAEQAGVDAYLNKPIPQAVLEQQLHQWLK